MASKQRQLFQRFEVQKFLGKGSYGSVYRVKRNDDEQIYAVKETDVCKMTQEERQDAANEIRLLASVKHPNIVRYYETFLDGNWLVIVMEYAQCGDLSHFIKKGKERQKPFPEEIVWNFFIQIIRGVEHLHNKKIMHRDIKPMNVFIGKGDIVKIGDLGIAKVLKNNEAQTQIGTPHYMAPEIWKSRSYTFAADIWSLGCLLYEMLTYRVPFEARSMAELKSKVMAGKVQPITAPYSNAMKNICMSMMQLDPAKRPSLTELLNVSEVQDKLGSVPGAKEADQVAPILKTIVVPKNLRNLSSALPDAAYDAIPADK